VDGGGDMTRHYFRVTFKLPGRRATLWARKAPSRAKGILAFREVDKEGVDKGHLILTHRRDILWARPARINPKYGELEVIKRKARRR